MLTALLYMLASGSQSVSWVTAQEPPLLQPPVQPALAQRLPVGEIPTEVVSTQQRPVRAASHSCYPTRLIEFTSSDSQPAPTGPVRCEVLVELSDGSLLAQTEDGQLWTLEKGSIISSAASDTPFTPLTSDQIYQQFQQELPEGFKVFQTRHFVLLYNTSEVYVKWVAELYEQVYRGFHSYWKSKGCRLSEPRFPLVAVVFSNRASYMLYAEREILSQPQAERTVATIIHEAVHQLSYNSGLQVRLADNPLWLSEGIAMFFETPDGNNPKGWGGTIGRINPHNMRLFAQYVPRRPADSLLTLISQDQRLRDASTSNQSYPESWALTYYLMLVKNKQFVAYLKELAEQPPLGETPERERVEMFKRHFGDDLAELDRDFINFFRRR